MNSEGSSEQDYFFCNILEEEYEPHFQIKEKTKLVQVSSAKPEYSAASDQEVECCELWSAEEDWLWYCVHCYPPPHVSPRYGAIGALPESPCHEQLRKRCSLEAEDMEY